MKVNGAGDDSAGILDETEDGIGGDTLAAAALADEGEGFAAAYGECYAVNSPDGACVGVKMCSEVVDLQYNVIVCGHGLPGGIRVGCVAETVAEEIETQYSQNDKQNRRH